MNSGFTAEMGRQQFLQLLVTQLQHQDPLSPVDQQDFISQLAQFSVVEGMEQLNLRFDDLIRLQSLSQGAELVGRTVEYLTLPNGDSAIGRIQQAKVADGELLLTIDGEQIPLSRIQSILAEAPAA